MHIKKELFAATKVYLGTWIVMLLIIGFLLLRSDLTFTESITQLGEVVTTKSFLIEIHLCFIVVYLLFAILRYIWRGYKKLGWRLAFKRRSFLLILPVLVGYISFKSIVAVNSTEAYHFDWDFDVENKADHSKGLYTSDGKHRGMSVFRLGGGDHPESMKALIKDHVEWVAVIPFLYQDNEETLKLRSSVVSGVWSRRDSLVIKKIDTLHKQGMRVHLKPHVWLGEGWRSNIKLSDADWDGWFEVYQKEMVQYAKIAEHTGTGLFCIGTELRTVIENRPDAWTALIREVKKVYSGKLTYAANWDDPIEKIPFWEEMDYIGIQAYFPLTKNSYPDIPTIKEGWDTHIAMLEKAAATYKKPILFTEVGYRSDASATVKPWEWGNPMAILYNKKSDRTQQFAYEALFETLWDTSWFAGCYIWQWHAETSKEGMETDVDFTPRFKPAENTIAKWYGTLGKPTKVFD